VDGCTKQKRRLVAKKQISAGLEMGGLGIPHPDEIINGVRQNFLQKIYRQYCQQPTAHLPAILTQPDLAFLIIFNGWVRNSGG
jgi:hypothetical protein